MESKEFIPQLNPVTNSFVNVSSKEFFSGKEDVSSIQENLLKITGPQDGAYKGFWILTIVDHWNNNIEKVLLLMENTLYIIRYDFVLKTVNFTQSISLKDIKEIKYGSLIYPEKSLMPARNCTGLEIIWGDMEQVTWTQRWNPLCRSIPSCVLINHPLFYGKLSNENSVDDDKMVKPNRNHYSIESFRQCIASLTSNEKVKAENIVIYCYGSISSTIFNQSALGFNKNRNGVSF